MSVFLAKLREIAGEEHVITEASQQSSFVIDQRGRFQGKALAVVLPNSSQQISEIVKLCAAHQVPIVSQGGNTGLVLASVPDQTGQAIIVSTRRMHAIRELDSANNTITVEAGCTLAQVQEAAKNQARFFPLSLASEGSCTIGGNLASNAGGTAVLRYGNMRELCLGLEVVLADGQIWHGLRGLRKDNTGYDLRDLFIGSEGTLGIITAAVLKLSPAPLQVHTAWLAVRSLDEVMAVFDFARKQFDASLTGFELISAACLKLVAKHFPQYQQPSVNLSTFPFTILLELSSASQQNLSGAIVEEALSEIAQMHQLEQIFLAQNQTQATEFWAIREAISPAQAKEGANIKHDISLPISAITHFCKETEVMLQNYLADLQIICFGHIGDGNLHYNISTPFGLASEDFSRQQAQVNRLVHDQVAKFHGSISAEHGIGMLKRDELQRYKSPVELALMRKIKLALDPDNLMNPGKILHARGYT